MIVTTTIGEVPTGAIADLFGKKRTLTIAFILEAFCNIYMGFALNLPMLLIAVFVGAIGGCLYSGTLDALVYDSLKQNNHQKTFGKIISNINSIQLISMTIASIVGGFLYLVNPRSPFLLLGMFGLIGALLTFWLEEPEVDTEKFNFANFINQNKQGLKQLFQNSTTVKHTITLMIIGGILLICEEMLDSVLALEFGFKPQSSGVLFSVVFLVSAVVSQLSPSLNRHLGSIKSLFLISLVVGLSFIISPYVGIVLGGLSLIIRNSSGMLYHNLASVVINEQTESKYRATTLSTFNMLKNLPYVFTAYLFGHYMDIIGARQFTFILGLVVIALIIFQYRQIKSKTVQLSNM